MFGMKGQSSAAPSALGTLVQASTYGMTIPVTIGMTRGAPLLIWAAGFSQGQCNGKKGKSGGILGFLGLAPPQYVEWVDFLLGHNPINQVLRWWVNGKLYNVGFGKYTANAGLGGSITLPSGPPYDSTIYVYAVTFTGYIDDFTFNDYGSPGPVTIPAGYYEIPMYNACMQGPDSSRSSAYRRIPFTYRYRPDLGLKTVYLDQNLQGGPDAPVDFNGGTYANTYNIYFAYGTIGNSHSSPTAAQCCWFESQLGDGEEYDPLPAQRIVYPEYAGLGSLNFDLGVSGQLPALGFEKVGSFISYPSGDADFADMIEYVVKSGQIQAGYAIESDDVLTNQVPLQHGLNCVDSPQVVQMKYLNFGEYATAMVVTLDKPVTQGNRLAVVYSTQDSISDARPYTISDSLGNSWTDRTSGGISLGSGWYVAAWDCVANATGNDTITLNWGGGIFNYGRRFALVEVQADSMDAPVVATGSGTSGAVSISTGGSARQPNVLVGFSAINDTIDNTPVDTINWNNLFGPLSGQPFSGHASSLITSDYFFAQERTVLWPGTYSYKFNCSPSGNNWFGIIYSFWNSQPSGLAQNYPNILDDASMVQCRNAARVGGLFGSIEMNSQRKASEWLEDFYYSMNAWPVWAGFSLLSIPRSEVSNVANAGVYFAWTGSGPVADLSDLNGDFIGDKSTPCITVERNPQVDRYNVLQIQHIDRNANYNQVVTSQPEPASIAILGIRKQDPQVHNEIQDPSVARTLLGIDVRRQTYLPNTYEWRANSKWSLLLPGDLITITDTLAGISSLPVRILSVEEDENTNELDMTAERFLYGLYAPSIPANASSPQPYVPNPLADPGSINTPIIFEAVPLLAPSITGSALMFVVSSNNPNFGGANVMLSIDGGLSYFSVGTIQGSAAQGVTTADWPAHADPDTTNDLPVDLTESNGVLLSLDTAEEDAFLFPCYVAGGAGNIPYELMAYAVATNTGPNTYTLKATGAGNYLRRSVFGAPTAGAGVDHPSGSAFAFVGRTPVSGLAVGAPWPGILQISMNPNWVGLTLHFKFLAFNTLGSNGQSLADATDYTFSPTGQVGSSSSNFASYTISGGTLTNPSSTIIAMAQATATWLMGISRFTLRAQSR